jgi:hypothetical protein
MHILDSWRCPRRLVNNSVFHRIAVKFYLFRSKFQTFPLHYPSLSRLMTVLSCTSCRKKQRANPFTTTSKRMYEKHKTIWMVIYEQTVVSCLDLLRLYYVPLNVVYVVDMLVLCLFILLNDDDEHNASVIMDVISIFIITWP